MKSEIIYKNFSTWRGRWGDERGREIVIFADFSNPANWPYSIECYNIEYDEDYNQIRTLTSKTKLSKELFNKLKNIIASNKEITAFNDHAQNSVMDGSNDSFYFCCDAFSKSVYGLSILSVGRYELEDRKAKSVNYHTFKIVDEIEKALKQAGISLY